MCPCVGRAVARHGRSRLHLEHSSTERRTTGRFLGAAGLGRFPSSDRRHRRRADRGDDGRRRSGGRRRRRRRLGVRRRAPTATRARRLDVGRKSCGRRSPSNSGRDLPGGQHLELIGTRHHAAWCSSHGGERDCCQSASHDNTDELVVCAPTGEERLALTGRRWYRRPPNSHSVWPRLGIDVVDRRGEGRDEGTDEWRSEMRRPGEYGRPRVTIRTSWSVPTVPTTNRTCSTASSSRSTGWPTWSPIAPGGTTSRSTTSRRSPASACWRRSSASIRRAAWRSGRSPKRRWSACSSTTIAVS